MQVKLTLLTLVALGVPALASAENPPVLKHGIMGYGLGLAEAHVTVSDKDFAIYVHPKDPSLLIQPRLAKLGAIGEWFLRDYRAAAEQLVAPAGCGISEVHVVTKTGETWEATYVCPDGVDLRKLVKQQRKSLRAGEPLQATGAP